MDQWRMAFMIESPDAEPGMDEEIFKMYDSDGNGVLSRTEFDEGNKKLAESAAGANRRLLSDSSFLI